MYNNQLINDLVENIVFVQYQIKNIAIFIFISLYNCILYN